MCYSVSAALLSCSKRQGSDARHPATTVWRVEALMLHWEPSLGTLLNGHHNCVLAGSTADVHILVFTNNHAYSAPLIYILRNGDDMHQHFGKVALTSSSSLGIPTSHLFLQVTLDRYHEGSLLPPVSFLNSELTQKTWCHLFHVLPS